jgi:hypothetical protein
VTAELAAVDARRRITEKQWQATVLEAAVVFGWRAYHTFDSRRSAGGWPDLALWHPNRHRFMLRELKTDKGRTSAAQEQMLLELNGCGLDVGVWRPADWNRVVHELGPNERGTLERPGPS